MEFERSFEITVYPYLGVTRGWWKYRINGVTDDELYSYCWTARAAAKRECRKIVREIRRDRKNTFVYTVKED